MKNNTVTEGRFDKNLLATINMVVGAILLLFAIMRTSWLYTNGTSSVYTEGIGWENHPWKMIYNTSEKFFIAEFFNQKCYYGYMIILGCIVLIIGIALKIYHWKTQNHNEGGYYG